MIRTLSAMLALSVALMNPLVWAETRSSAAPVNETTLSAQSPDAGDVSIVRTYTYVAPEQIEIEPNASMVHKLDVGDEIKRKVLAEFVPVRLTVQNKSGKLLNIPNNSAFLVDEEGRKYPVPTEEQIFKEVKRNGVVRSLGWGLPLGAASFGILLVPAMLYSGVHTKVMNNGVKDNLASNAFHGAHISPDGVMTTYLFVPKRQASKIKKVMLSRVINVEDEVETQYITEIQTLETAKK